MFETNGEHPAWKVFYDAISKLDVNEIITYDELTEIAEFNIRNNRAPFYAAVQRLQTEDKRTMVNVPKIGYRVAQASEHANIGKKYQKKAKRSVFRGLKVVRNTDVTGLSQEERETLDGVTSVLTKHNRMLINHNKRLKTLEEAKTKTDHEIQTLREEQERLNAKLARLADRQSVSAND
jgi:hypothetical protein